MEYLLGAKHWLKLFTYIHLQLKYYSATMLEEGYNYYPYLAGEESEMHRDPAPCLKSKILGSGS